jgi:hypothetical protein
LYGNGLPGAGPLLLLLLGAAADCCAGGATRVGSDLWLCVCRVVVQTVRAHHGAITWCVFAQLMQLRIMADDIIVSGTDGLFDNVFAEEVASLVTFARKRGDSPALAATVLASYTQLKAADTTHMSPFAYAAQVLMSQRSSQR